MMNLLHNYSKPKDLFAGSSGDPSVVDPPTGDPPTGDPPTGDPPTGDHPTGDPPTGDPPTGDIPNMIELVRFRGRDKRINIPQEIGTNYYQFGMLLLADENGKRVDIIESECRGKTEQINLKILKQWIKGKGKQPVTWGTLVEVLYDVELTVLANDIAAVK